MRAPTVASLTLLVGCHLTPSQAKTVIDDVEGLACVLAQLEEGAKEPALVAELCNVDLGQVVNLFNAHEAALARAAVWHIEHDTPPNDDLGGKGPR